MNPSDRYAIAIETSPAPPAVGGVALGCGREVLVSRNFDPSQSHARDLMLTIAALCREHSIAPGMLDQIYVSIGPGSFTGLRIGIMTARALALAVGSRVVGVPSLEIIAQNALDLDDPPRDLAVLVDAKRGRVYGAVFVRDGRRYRCVQAATEVEPGAILASLSPGAAVAGTGVRHHATAVEASGLRVLPEELYGPRAATVYALGHAQAADSLVTEPRELVPLYIRPPEAEEKWARCP